MIVEAGQRDVSDPATVAEVIREAAEEGKDAVLFLIEREGETRFVAIPLMTA